MIMGQINRVFVFCKLKHLVCDFLRQRLGSMPVWCIDESA